MQGYIVLTCISVTTLFPFSSVKQTDGKRKQNLRITVLEISACPPTRQCKCEKCSFSKYKSLILPHLAHTNFIFGKLFKLNIDSIPFYLRFWQEYL